MRESKEILEIKKKAAEYQAQGLYKQALQELQKLLNYPDAVDEGIYQKIGELHKKLGNKKEALEYYLKAMEGYKKHGAHSYLIPLYKKILEIEPTKKELLIDLAESYYQRGMITEAAKALHEYADYVYKKGEIEKSFEVYKKLMQLIPENILLKKEVAELYLLHNLPKEAWKIYRDIFEHYKKIGREDKLMEIREKMEEIEIILGEEKIEIEETQEIERIEKEDEEEKDFVSVEDLLKGDRIGFREFIIKPEKKLKEEKVEEIQELKEEVPKEKAPVEEFPKEEVLEEKGEEVEPKIKAKKWEQIVEMGDIYLELGEKEEALKEYYTAAEGYYKEKDFMNAIKVYKKITDLFPLELQARQKLVQIAQQIKDKNLLVESLLELANCLYERGDKEKAKIWYLQILKRADPNCKEARERLMVLAPDLLEKLEKKVEPEPVVIERKEEKKEKIKEEVFEEVEIVSEGEFIDLGEEIRKELEKEEVFMKKEEKEIFDHIKESIYTHAEKVDPVYALEVGIAMKELGLFEEAILNLKKALAGDNRIKKEAYYYLGQIFVEMKKYDMAIENLLNALNIKTQEEEKERAIYYELGKAYEAINNFREAIKYYKILYEKDPTYKELKEKIIQLAKKVKSLGRENL